MINAIRIAVEMMHPGILPMKSFHDFPCTGFFRDDVSNVVSCSSNAPKKLRMRSVFLMAFHGIVCRILHGKPLKTVPKTKFPLPAAAG